eukprot:scaffold32422_cov94-Isochrysis_galbana.AAC.3
MNSGEAASPAETAHGRAKCAKEARGRSVHRTAGVPSGGSVGNSGCGRIMCRAPGHVRTERRDRAGCLT